MIGTTKAATLPQIEQLQKPREKGFVIPPPQKDEIPEPYITAVKANAPVEFFTIGGINFEKAVLPADFSVVDKNGNNNKLFFPKMLCKMMTKSQADAIFAEASTRVIYIPTLKNPNFDPHKDMPSKQYMPGGSFKMGDMMILEPQRTFDASKYPVLGSTWQPTTQSAITEAKPEEIKAELYELQRQAPIGKKK